VRVVRKPPLPSRGGGVWWWRPRQAMGGFDPHARYRMSTWLGARLWELPAGSDPHPHGAGSTCPARGRACSPLPGGVLPDLSGPPPTPANAGAPERAGARRPVMAVAVVKRSTASMRCGRGFDERAAAGVGELFGAVDATCGTSQTLGGLGRNSVWEVTNRGDRAPWSRDGTRPRPGAARCAHCRRNLGVNDGADVEGFRAGVHYPTGLHRQSVGLGHGTALWAPARASPEVFTSSITITGSGISAPTASASVGRGHPLAGLPPKHVDRGGFLRTAGEQTARALRAPAGHS
jgi:hypothetical protein